MSCVNFVSVINRAFLKRHRSPQHLLLRTLVFVCWKSQTSILFDAIAAFRWYYFLDNSFTNNTLHQKIFSEPEIVLSSVFLHCTDNPPYSLRIQCNLAFGTKAIKVWIGFFVGIAQINAHIINTTIRARAPCHGQLLSTQHLRGFFLYFMLPSMNKPWHKTVPALFSNRSGEPRWHWV